MRKESKKTSKIKKVLGLNFRQDVVLFVGE
jgi:hypothetical protein